MVEPLALVLVAIALPGVVWPYRVAEIGEMVDAIGSRRSIYDVEPTDWMVTLTRIVGIIGVGVGLLFFVSG